MLANGTPITSAKVSATETSARSCPLSLPTRILVRVNFLFALKASAAISRIVSRASLFAVSRSGSSAPSGSWTHSRR